jgi:hypothetical protein
MQKREIIAETSSTSQKDSLFKDQTEPGTNDEDFLVKLSYRQLICCPRVVFAA